MANPQRGEVGFRALDKDWTIKIGTNAMCELEGDFGKGINEIGKLVGDTEKFELKTMRKIFLRGMQEFHEELQTNDIRIAENMIGNILDDIGLEQAVGIMGRAFVLSAPEQEAGKANPRRAKAA